MRDERALSQRTMELAFSVLSSFYEYLIFENHLQANPVPAIRKRYLKRYKDNSDLFIWIGCAWDAYNISR